MKNQVLLLFCILFIIFQNCVNYQTDEQKDAETEYSLLDYYPVNLENEYIYKVTRNENIVEEKRYFETCERTNDGKTFWILISGNIKSTGFLSEKGLELSSANKITYTPPIHSFRNIIIPGDVITNHIQLIGTEFSNEVVINCTIDGLETVETPAGIFKDCIRFSFYFNTPENTEDMGILRRRGWLAKDIGMIKAHFYDPSGNLLVEEILLSAKVGGKEYSPE